MNALDLIALTEPSRYGYGDLVWFRVAPMEAFGGWLALLMAAVSYVGFES